MGNVVLGEESVGIANEIPNAHAEKIDLKSKEHVETGPASASGVSGLEEHSVTDDPAMKSTLVPNDVLQWYMKAEERLCKDLKQMSMEDHDWSLRSWDQNGARVVKLYCGECWSLIGGSMGKHTKNSVTNFFLIKKNQFK